MATKTLYAEVHPLSGDVIGDEPCGIRVEITGEMADMIRRHAALVRITAHMYKIELFDRSAVWLDEEPTAGTDVSRIKESACRLEDQSLSLRCAICIPAGGCTGT